MPFQLTEDQKAIRRATRAFGEEHIEPVAKEYNEKKKFPEEIVRKAAKQDLVAPNLPERYGGAGVGTVAVAVITEELWRADPGVGGAVSSAAFGTNMIHRFGDEWMKEEWFPKITSGESQTAAAISEPAHGSDAAGIETTAERDGDEWVVDGQKMWITNGTVADVAVVMAKTTPGQREKGISAFLVPTDVDGLEAHKIDNKLGIHASDLAELTLDDVRVPEENLIGREDKGFYQLMEFFGFGRTAVAAQAVGAMQAALDESVEYAQRREQFGQPIAGFQAIQHKVADMATTVEAARSLVYRAADALDRGDEDAARWASMAKLFASENSVDVTDEAIQVHGGAGYVTDHPVERYFRDARITKIYEGTSEIQRNIIADRIF
jgi:alkylation response protein AidB-like acyl-CoA dehydrogenase